MIKTEFMSKAELIEEVERLRGGERVTWTKESLDTLIDKLAARHTGGTPMNRAIGIDHWQELRDTILASQSERVEPKCLSCGHKLTHIGIGWAAHSFQECAECDCDTRGVRQPERVECPTPEIHDEIIRCYVDNGPQEMWAKFCPRCGLSLKGAGE